MNQFVGKWLPKMGKSQQLLYVKACQDIVAKNLKGFKRHLGYSIFVGNDLRDKTTTILFYEYIKENYPSIFKRLQDFQINDKIGTPNLFEIDKTPVSPGTLRFMKVLGDITNSFELQIKSIIEIGAGYGGQCLIVKTWDKNIDYTILDIPVSLLVSQKYLKENKIESKFISSENVENVADQYDLCISDYCLSELDEKGVQFYLDNILSKSKQAYITTNSLGQSLGFLVKQLFTVYETVSVRPEIPKTSPHLNYIIICKENKLMQ